MKMSKFFGNPQRFIILEGTPESDIEDIAKKVKELSSHALVINLPGTLGERDWTIEEFAEDVKEIVHENIDSTVVFTQFTLPEYMFRNNQANKIKLLEMFMNEYPAYAFFVVASRGFYYRRVNNSELAAQLYLKQSMYEEAYKKNMFDRKFLLSRDGYTAEGLAKTIMFQSEICQVTCEIEEV